MANWLSRATSLFQQPPPPPEPFEVECDCGGKVVGQRTKNYQRPICAVCEHPVFVLPANIYPRPKLKSTGNNKSAKNATNLKPTKATVETVVDTGSPPAPSKTAPNTKSTSESVKNVPNAAREQFLKEPTRPILTRLRMIIAAIMMLSAAMVGGIWHRYRIERAKAEVSQAADAGMAALLESDFVRASREFEHARDAVDLIGRTDPAANDIRRFSREATAIHKLAANSLTDILQTTLSTKILDGADSLRMSSLDKGAWVIFDANLALSLEGKNRYLIDAPLLFAEASVRVEIESDLFRLLPNADESADIPRVIFAAQLEQLSLPHGEPPTAILSLNGKSAFLWTSYETYAAAGYRPIDGESEQQTRAVIARQLELSKAR